MGRKKEVKVQRLKALNLKTSKFNYLKESHVIFKKDYISLKLFGDMVVEWGAFYLFIANFFATQIIGGT